MKEKSKHLKKRNPSSGTSMVRYKRDVKLISIDHTAEIVETEKES
jgi:hypothetical protein